MFRRFISYYKPHKKLFAADMAAAMTISLLGMVYPFITRTMLNDYIPNANIRAIVISGLVVLGLYILRWALNYFVQYYGHMIGVRMQSQMRRDLFAHLQKLPFSYFDNNETGRIMTRITSDLFEICELAHHGPESLLTCSVMMVLSFVYLCSIKWQLALIVFACVPILIVTSYFLRRSMKQAFADRRKSNAIINAAVESSITGIRVTKAYTNAATEKDKFKVGDDTFVNSSRRAYKAMARFHSTTSFISDVFNVIILIAGGLFLFYDPTFDFGDYSAFIVSVGLFTGPVNSLIFFMESFQNGASGFQRFCELMDEPAEVESPDAVELTDVEGVIEFEGVNYSYVDSKEVLHDIDLRLEKGRKLALVGPSGGGKTTLCQLIPRFCPISIGSVRKMVRYALTATTSAP